MFNYLRMILTLCFASTMFHCGSEFSILMDDPTPIYWSEAGGVIMMIYSDGNGMRTVANTAPAVPLDVALDTAGEMVYWTEYTGTHYRIMRAGLYGRGKQLYIEYPAGSNHGPTAIGIDSVEGKIYWNRRAPDNHDIMRGTLTEKVPAAGQLWLDNINNNYQYTYSISIDEVSRKIYFTAGSYWDINTPLGSGDDGRIYRGLLSTYSTFASFLEDEGYGSPSIPFRGIAVDGEGGYTYYVDNTDSSLSIRRADLNVNNRMDWVDASGFQMQKIALDLKERKIYWTSNIDNSIYRADLDSPNSNIELFLRLDSTPTGIAVSL